MYGDALWASGLFEEAEARYREALALTPELPRGLHGMARSLLARNQLDDAMNQAQAALRLAPRDLEIHHTVGAIYERMHKYEEAAAAYGNYVNLLPNKDRARRPRGRAPKSGSCDRSPSACRFRPIRVPTTRSSRSTSGW